MPVDDLLDRLLIDVDPDAPPTNLDDAIVEFLLRLVSRNHTTSVDASTTDESIKTEAA